MAKVRTAGNNSRAQILITHECKKGIIDNGTSFFGAFALRSVTLRAEDRVSARPLFGVARFSAT
jgi:hypothetical protein